MKSQTFRAALAQGLESVRANPKSLLLAAAAVAVTATPAHAQGLSNAKSVVDKFKTEVLGIIPAICVVALILIGAAYAFKLAEKEVLIRWGAGVLIIGAASGIVDLFLGNAGT